MIKFFRKIRQKLLSENKLCKYLIYAIGEIVLVVLGILIALQINNWNENKKQILIQNKILLQIQSDLQKDTIHIVESIQMYKEKNERLENIIFRKIPISYYQSLNQENYGDCKECKIEVTYFWPFKNHNKGYSQLKSFNTNLNEPLDSLLVKIDQFYHESEPSVKFSNEILRSLMNQNIKSYVQYDWFIDWRVTGNKKFNKDYVKYIFESKDYRIKSAQFLTWTRTHLFRLKLYKEKATEILKLIDIKLKK